MVRVRRQPWLASAGAAVAAAFVLTTCHGAATPMHAAQPPSMPTFGSASAYVDPNKPLQNLTVAAIESGQATATGTPVAVQEAFLKNVVGNATTPGHQSVNCGRSRLHTWWHCDRGVLQPLLCYNRSDTESGPGRHTDCHPVP